MGREFLLHLLCDQTVYGGLVGIAPFSGVQAGMRLKAVVHFQGQRQQALTEIGSTPASFAHCTIASWSINGCFISCSITALHGRSMSTLTVEQERPQTQPDP